MERIIIVKYGELWLKSEPVRRRFEKILKGNIKREFARQPNAPKARSHPEILVRNGRIFIHSSEKTNFDFLNRTFGVVSYAEGLRVNKDIEEIKKAAEKLISKKKTFVIRAKRSDKSFPLDSQQIQRVIGMHLESIGHHADIQNPQQTIKIEIRDQAYLYANEIKGPGGLPLGTAGFVQAMLRDDNDLAAAWLMMKRGADCLFIGGKTTTRRVVHAPPNSKLLKFIEKWSVGRKVIKAKKNEKIHVLISSKEEKVKNTTVLNPLVGFSDQEKKELIKKIKS